MQRLLIFLLMRGEPTVRRGNYGEILYDGKQGAADERKTAMGTLDLLACQYWAAVVEPGSWTGTGTGKIYGQKGCRCRHSLPHFYACSRAVGQGSRDPRERAFLPFCYG